MKSTRRSLGALLLAVGLGAGCASVSEQRQTTPHIGLRLKPLQRDHYRVGEPVSGTATVQVERTFAQKVLPFLFGSEVVRGDREYSMAMGVSNASSTQGQLATMGASTGSASSQLGQLLRMVGEAVRGKSAVSLATETAYFRALHEKPGVDFLLEPRVTVQTSGSSSIFFFLTDNEEATVTVTGRPVSVLTDEGIAEQEKARAAELAALQQPPPPPPPVVVEDAEEEEQEEKKKSSSSRKRKRRAKSRK